MSEFKKTIAYFQESASRDWALAQQLFERKYYSYSLFFCHLTLEKILKAVVVKRTDEAAPFTHDLVKLAELAKLPVDKETVLSLDEITKFNVSTRYDDEQFAFYKKATKEFAEEYFKTTEKIYSWIKENYLTT